MNWVYALLRKIQYKIMCNFCSLETYSPKHIRLPKISRERTSGKNNTNIKTISKYQILRPNYVFSLASSSSPKPLVYQFSKKVYTVNILNSPENTIPTLQNPNVNG